MRPESGIVNIGNRMTCTYKFNPYLDPATPRVQPQYPFAVLQVWAAQHGLGVSLLIAGHMLSYYLSHERANVRVYHAIQKVACEIYRVN